jgi:general secretion pathway protein A
MFLEFYKLREQPFSDTPDPRYVYLSRTHREALASLFYGIDAGRGFLALIAEPGMGKTTLLFHLLERLRGSARTAFLFQT